MDRYIRRKRYLQKLIDRRDNGEVKIITDPRRSGKSFLLKRIYFDYLLADGVLADHIIIASLDVGDEASNQDLRVSEALKSFLYERIKDDGQSYYVMLDEIQEVEGFERIVNGLNARDNVDVYVTGSNSRFLSSDISATSME